MASWAFAIIISKIDYGVQNDQNGEETATTMICESVEPTRDTQPAFIFPELPTAIETSILCPEGYRNLQ